MQSFSISTFTKGIEQLIGNDNILQIYCKYLLHASHTRLAVHNKIKNFRNIFIHLPTPHPNTQIYLPTRQCIDLSSQDLTTAQWWE